MPAPADPKTRPAAKVASKSIAPTVPVPGPASPPVASAPAALPSEPAQPGIALPESGPVALDQKDKEALDRLMKTADNDGAVDLARAARARSDFMPRQSVDRATLVWNPAWHVPAAGAPLAFDVPAGAARYRILIVGHTDDGRFGNFEDRLVVTPATGREAGRDKGSAK
jgi:hypothetical protein